MENHFYAKKKNQKKLYCYCTCTRFHFSIRSSSFFLLFCLHLSGSIFFWTDVIYFSVPLPLVCDLSYISFSRIHRSETQISLLNLGPEANPNPSHFNNIHCMEAGRTIIFSPSGYTWLPRASSLLWLWKQLHLSVFCKFYFTDSRPHM